MLDPGFHELVIADLAIPIEVARVENAVWFELREWRSDDQVLPAFDFDGLVPKMAEDLVLDDPAGPRTSDVEVIVVRLEDHVFNYLLLSRKSSPLGKTLGGD